MTFAELHQRIQAGWYLDTALIYQDQQTERYYIGSHPHGLLVGTVGEYRERWGI